ncbi:hypothetical protein MCOR25_004616 [Pyricularia grisea]|uniref:Aminotransferase class I/classII large domain-containing protein n=1 Tax=Pyricularia grisea TaxID=148305 RepID=A0A6P8B843_PYRGI|nr:uncharacterized protein PgNI_03936 [Pyricularia grisea]KAI6368661.1 hypothetical protein MCOR25_004616 [Pyricularia grisea]TLD12020.1 hypothetical protein PgNI_03936 [Pyricularia grisea]
MVRIEPFHVEQWMDKYETKLNVLNVSETCVASQSIDDLLELSDGKSSIGSVFSTSKKLTYGAILGSESLRSSVAGFYTTETGTQLSPENVLITPGAIFANFLLYYTLIGPGDHVVCVYPTYQQLYSVPQSLGAEVSLWKLSKENSYVPNMEELAGLVRTNTKMIVINNPNNPTGAPIPRRILEEIVQFASSRNIIVFSDEVYRPLFHSLEQHSDPPPSILSMSYDKAIATGSMSKAWSLAGVRVGWVACCDKSIIDAMATARDYTTISVSQLDDQLASFALSDSVRPALLDRNMTLAHRNLCLLEDFVKKHDNVCSWVKPRAGTTAFIQFFNQSKPVDDEKFCIDVINTINVMLVPGSKCFGNGGDGDFKGFIRLGYACETDVLEEALKRLEGYIKQNLS